MRFDTDNAIAFFDFDLTLTTRDTIRDFPRRLYGRVGFSHRLLSVLPFLYAFKAGLCSATQAKEAYVTRFYAGMKQQDILNRGADYSRTRIPNILNHNMLKRLQLHQECGHTVVVVSASLSVWLAPWCASLGIDLLATEIECIDGIVTGNLSGLNCHGDEKVKRIRERYNLSNFDEIYAYGDSNADLPMLAIADHAWFKGKPIEPQRLTQSVEKISHAG
ncbi:MAG: HAD-IB family hydrolase [Alcanivoracaceae bacterium]|nr:HAD-IB family hydrolase [Alcanivoracaceae bacterium]